MQRTGTAAILAIVAALGGLMATFTGHPVWGLILALLAILLGAVGLVRAASPRVSGGILSIVAIIVAVVGLGVAGLGMVGTLMF